MIQESRQYSIPSRRYKHLTLFINTFYLGTLCIGPGGNMSHYVTGLQHSWSGAIT